MAAGAPKGSHQVHQVHQESHQGIMGIDQGGIIGHVSVSTFDAVAEDKDIHDT